MRHDLVVLAEKIATEAHKGQFRADGKTPFIEHPKAVAAFFSDDEWQLKVIAWLHDVIEDTKVDYYNSRCIHLVIHRHSDDI